MKSDIEIILNDTKSALEKLYGKRLEKILLYGSYARGNQHSDSDIDLLLVLTDNQISAVKELKSINRQIYPLKLKYNKDIAVYPVTHDRLITEKSFFYNRIKAEGIEL